MRSLRRDPLRAVLDDSRDDARDHRVPCAGLDTAWMRGRRARPRGALEQGEIDQYAVRSRVSIRPASWKARAAARADALLRDLGGTSRRSSALRPNSHAAARRRKAASARASARVCGAAKSASALTRRRQSRRGADAHLYVGVAALDDHRHDLARRRALGRLHRRLDRRDAALVEQLARFASPSPDAPPPPKPPPPPEKPPPAPAESTAASEPAAAEGLRPLERLPRRMPGPPNGGAKKKPRESSSTTTTTIQSSTIHFDGGVRAPVAGSGEPRRRSRQDRARSRRHALIPSPRRELGAQITSRTMRAASASAGRLRAVADLDRPSVRSFRATVRITPLSRLACRPSGLLGLDRSSPRLESSSDGVCHDDLLTGRALELAERALDRARGLLGERPARSSTCRAARGLRPRPRRGRAGGRRFRTRRARLARGSRSDFTSGGFSAPGVALESWPLLRVQDKRCAGSWGSSARVCCTRPPKRRSAYARR